MQFKKGYFRPFSTNSVAWQRGEFWATYQEVVAIFGHPNRGPGPNRDNDHITTEWIIEFEDGTIATICDFKTAELQTPIGMYGWKIGGITGTSVTYVKQVINEHRKGINNA